MKFIERIQNYVNFLAGKNIASYRAPEQLDEVVYKVLIDIFNEYYDHYAKTRKISDYLLPFKRSTPATPVDGYFEIPSECEHITSVSTPAGVAVDELEDKFWYNRVSSSIAPPTTTNPICRTVMRGNPSKKNLQVYPSTAVVIEYLKKPSPPKYAYTISGNRYVYDESSSVDVEFSELLFDDIQKRVLLALGVNLNDQRLIQYAAQYKITDQAK